MNKITLENFRCFHEEQSARLAPLTLLVGENSTGKTSFMAMIRALWDVAYQDIVPDFKENPYDLGSFDEVAHHRGARGSRASSFSAKFEFTRKKRGSENNSSHFEVTFEKRGTIPSPTKRRHEYNGDWIEHRMDRNERKENLLCLGTSKKNWEYKNPLDQEMLLALLDQGQVPPVEMLLWRASQQKLRGRDKSNGLRSVHRPSSLPTDDEWARLRRVVFKHQFLFPSNPLVRGRPYASAPVRSKPRRTYDPSRPTRDPEGEYIPMYLASMFFQNKKEWKKLKAALESFGHEAGLFDEVSVKHLGKEESEPFQLQIRKRGKRLQGPLRNLIDVGYGVSQVLPVITELLRPDAPTMFLMQQPEVHLHPSAQAALGSLFCETAGPKRQLVVETHSDHLLDRVRMDIRDGSTKLKPEDVSILFFEREDLEVRIYSLQLDNQGNILNAPESYRKFFMEETLRSLKL